ncbi:6712_t:CDS:1 [Paraglomus brasilianum]|uniref:6712_t:CDS:1 n=1 Tax=Paraglomus brasilianum TaxID=144538 RepID=A0A9N9DYT0_9GLOM|nr:6712_t:CDS:1 [Paraglomus brasilianum]
MTSVSPSNSPQNVSKHVPYDPPNLLPFLIGVSLVSFELYLDLFPQYQPPPVAALRAFVGPHVLRGITYFMVTVHSLETLYVIKVLRSRGETDWKNIAMWVVASLCLGLFGSYKLFKKTDDTTMKGDWKK